jgi:hypothetical protein
MSDDLEHMDIAEFVSEGYLQEVNRQFFHPLGLALEVTVEDDGSTHISGVWDGRDDPEGFIFGDELDREKCLRMFDEVVKRRPVRTEALGYFYEPIPAY